MRFVINGEALTLTVTEVVDSMDHADPEPVRAHGVIIGGREFPVKQAFEIATGKDRAIFTSHRAIDVFRRLGFELRRHA